uniref:F-box containing protein n=1 Tax=Marseillevirus sp. TaxID=2809551 RepID=A0AA96J0P0_9VIRU|nr:F-box containing protein [Marseillevirus sp.]
MLDKLPIDITFLVLGNLSMRDIASVDRSTPKLGFACGQVFLKNEKYQRRVALLRALVPHLKYGEKWSSPARINALKRVSRYRHKSNPFEVPKNKRVLKEQKRKRRLANKILDNLLEERPSQKETLLEQLMICRYGEEKEMDETIIRVWRLLLESSDNESGACDWVDNYACHIFEEFSDSDSD